MKTRTTIFASMVALSWLTLGAGARADLILETAEPGPNPTPAIGIAALQWIGARFTVTQTVQVDHIGANLEGANTIFGAIVPLSGPGGLPQMPPSQIESYALAGTAFPVTLSVADYSAPLAVSLAPGDYGVVFGVGPFGSSGGANLTDGNIPTSQASFFSALPFFGDVWLDRSDLSGLRLFVTGTQAVPEPSTLGVGALGAVAFIAYGWLRHRREQRRQAAA
jgi:hypothetical protein